MEKPHLYTVIYKNSKGKNIFFETDNEDTALRKEIIKNGVTYIDTRYKAKLRLFNYLSRKICNFGK